MLTHLLRGSRAVAVPILLVVGCSATVGVTRSVPGPTRAVAVPLANGAMRPSVEWDDAPVTEHLVEHYHVVGRLDDLMIRAK